MSLTLKLLKENIFSPIDYFGALHAIKEENESERALIATLLLSTRLGNLSLIAEEKELKEFFKTYEIPLTDVQEQELIALIVQGVSTVNHPHIVKMGTKLTLKRYQEKENKIFETLKQLEKPKTTYEIDDSLLNGLLPEQSYAIKQGAKEAFTIIVGGPGTGKTFTAGVLVKALSDKNLKMALAAPTGKAAINLKKSFRSEIEATTLHSLLNYKGRETKILPYDLLIVDEGSMIDLSLMEALISSLKPQSRLILLGDPHQLPPVEVGQIFPKIVASFPEFVVRLKQVMRTENQEILHLAHLVKEGQPVESFLREKRETIQFKQTIDFDTCLKKCLPWLEVATKEEALLQLKKSSLLSPLKKGPFGFEKLNSALFAALKQMRKDLPIPIMITKNDKRRSLFNGQMGVLFQKGWAVFENETIEAIHLPPYEVAFCLSVHKSQGSEFDEVTLLLPEGSDVFGKELLYTGITRAKKHLTLMGDLKS